MRINDKYEMVLKSNGMIMVCNNELKADRIYTETDQLYQPLREFYYTARNTNTSVRDTLDSTVLDQLFGIAVAETVAENPTTPLTEQEITIKALEKLVKFFTEFQFEPNFRFVNSLSLALANSKAQATRYISNYFELIDNPYTKEINSKVKSKEFADILNELATIPPTKTINNRFKLYYGSQGTGKTTQAMQESGGRCMVCNNSMLPQDLMEDFTFENGQATFKPSALWRSMVDGTPIVLDEINLLPFDSLRFLQTILDGKTEFLYKGNQVVIADGFKIIGTMNLTVNGMTYALPEPLVDRAETTKKFTLTAKDLLNAIM